MVEGGGCIDVRCLVHVDEARGEMVREKLHVHAGSMPRLMQLMRSTYSMLGTYILYRYVSRVHY